MAPRNEIYSPFEGVSLEYKEGKANPGRKIEKNEVTGEDIINTESIAKNNKEKEQKTTGAIKNIRNKEREERKHEKPPILAFNENEGWPPAFHEGISLAKNVGGKKEKEQSIKTIEGGVGNENIS